MSNKFVVVPDGKDLQVTIDFLKNFQKWRRDGEGEMPSPFLIGVHLDIAIQALGAGITPVGK